MDRGERMGYEAIAGDLERVELWRDTSEVAGAAAQLLAVYREIAPLGRRLLSLPPAWSAAYEEVLLLIRHLAETLGELRPQARLVLAAFGGGVGAGAGESSAAPAAEIPNFAPADLLAKMIEQLDALGPVARLPEVERSLFPLHLAEIAAEAQAVTELETWTQAQDPRSAFTPRLLCAAAAALERHLAVSHIYDRSESERGLLTIIDRILAPRE